MWGGGGGGEGEEGVYDMEDVYMMGGWDSLYTSQ